MRNKALLLGGTQPYFSETLIVLHSPHQEIPTVFSCGRCVLTWTF